MLLTSVPRCFEVHPHIGRRRAASTLSLVDLVHTMVRSAKTLGVYAVRQWFVPIPHAVKAPTTKITPAPHCTGTDQTPTQPIQVIISVDATPFFKASATRGDVWVDCWGGNSPGCLVMLQTYGGSILQVAITIMLCPIRKIK